MERVFGAPIGQLSLVLAVLMAAAGGVIGVLALRHRVFFRMGVRNIGRRPARSLLIVAGLMLGTAIICSALVTGDTMGRTVRGAVLEALGNTDEQVVVRGTASTDQPIDAGAAAPEWFDQGVTGVVERAARESGLVDAVAPAVIQTVAVQDRTSRQNEPRVTLFASDPTAMERLAPMRDGEGRSVSLSQLQADEVFLDDDAAKELHAAPGDELVVLAGDRMVEARVRAVVDVDGAGTSDAAMIVPLDRAQAALGRVGQVTHVLVSNTGDSESGAALTERVTAALDPVLAPLGLEANPVKQDGLELADTQGNAFMTMFTTFGSFSMAAGILLIFLVFVMLAAERRGEMGMARAVGTQRRHLVETFLFEGAAYDVASAAVGALLGVGVAYGMVAVTASAFAGEDFEIDFGLHGRSLVVAYGIGVLLTLAVVAFSAWRVSRLNIVSAIRDIPEEAHAHRRRRWARAMAAVSLGTLIAVSGASSGQATPFNLGVSIVIAGLVLVATALGAGPRLAYTVAGTTMVVWWLLPMDTIPFVRGLSQDISIWIVGGLAIVVGATWTVMYNADALLGATMRVVGRSRSLVPVMRMAMAYPLRNRFRTAVTLMMFMLVVFTMVSGSTIPGSFMAAVDDKETFGGGFDVRATTFGAGGVDDLRVPGVNAVGNQSVVPVKMRQEGADGTADYADYVVRGVDDDWLSRTTYGMAATAKGYGSAREVWDAVAREPGLAVVDSLVAPRRDAYMVGTVLPDFALTGFYVDDGVFDPVPVTVLDESTGATVALTVIGVVSDASPYELTAGVSVSQRALAPLGDRARPTVHWFSVAPGVEAAAVATELERTYLSYGLEAESVDDILDRVVGGSRTFISLIQGFMGLGLLVGVAALGVISARSVVERRQQLGVLRAIGFQPAMIRRTLILESSFVAVSAIVIGTALALVMSRNVVADTATQPGWENLRLTVPWLNLGVVFAVVFLAALGATFASAVRASRVYPAEALRYR